jgi:perosamine synthetase
MIAHSKPWITEEDTSAVLRQIQSNNIAAGAKVEEFTALLKAYFSTKHIFLTTNGSNAIYIALLALGIKTGDEVILPAYVCRNVLDAILHCGATPVLCDIGNYWTMEIENVAGLITKKTKAIIIVHSLGIAIDVKLFRKFGIPIIEDCCQCFSNKVGDLQPGSDGDISVYSFNATKCLTTGEGGGIGTKRADLAAILKEILKNKSIYNPLTDLQAALGISQILRYEEVLQKRKIIADIYFNTLNKSLLKDFSVVRSRSIYFRFLLTSDTPNFNEFQNYMSDNGVAIRKGVDTVLNIKNSTVIYNNSLRAIKRTISIPIYPSLTLEEVSHITKTINKYEFI